MFPVLLYLFLNDIDVLAEVNPSGGIYLDLLNLQWWQLIVGIVVALGMSPAPWITALATGRLLFRGDLDQRLKERDLAHEKALAQRDAYHEALLRAKDERYAELQQSNKANADAARQERERADRATAQLSEVTEALEASSHIMAALRDTLTEVAKDG